MRVRMMLKVLFMGWVVSIVSASAQSLHVVDGSIGNTKITVGNGLIEVVGIYIDGEITHAKSVRIQAPLAAGTNSYTVVARLSVEQEDDKPEYFGMNLDEPLSPSTSISVPDRNGKPVAIDVEGYVFSPDGATRLATFSECGITANGDLLKSVLISTNSTVPGLEVDSTAGLLDDIVRFGDPTKDNYGFKSALLVRLSPDLRLQRVTPSSGNSQEPYSDQP